MLGRGLLRELLTESGESKRTERKTEIAQGHVEVPGNQEEIDDDAEQPRRHNVRADSWTHGNEHGGRHLNDPDEEHERVTRDRKQPLDARERDTDPSS